MIEQSIVSIRNVDELKKVLFIQRNVTQQARSEMLALMADGVAVPREPQRFFDDAKKLLEKYANYPTLTEFAQDPQLLNLTKWGATFGVAALVGGLVLEQARQMQPEFEPILRQMFIVLLTELCEPKHKYLMEPIEKALHVKASGEDVPPEDAATFIKGVAFTMTETFVVVGVNFGLMASAKEGITITPVGRRVLLHLLDTQRFVEEMVVAHTRFQSVRPKLNMA